MNDVLMNDKLNGVRGGSRLSYWGDTHTFVDFFWHAVDGAKRRRLDSELSLRIEGRARENSGEGSGKGDRWAPPQKIFGRKLHEWWDLVHTSSKYIMILQKKIQTDKSGLCHL